MLLMPSPAAANKIHHQLASTPLAQASPLPIPHTAMTIQIMGFLGQAVGISVELMNGALANNIFWQVLDHVKVGKGAHIQGIMLLFTNSLFETGSSLSGSVLAHMVCALQAGINRLPNHLE